MFIIRLTESPKIIIFTRPFTITGIPENSSIISDRVSFIFKDTLDLLFEIININHNLYYTNSTQRHSVSSFNHEPV